MARHLFIGGVPATGKSWLGSWLSTERGYLNIDAERNRGADFDRLGVHPQWDDLIATGRAKKFSEALSALSKSVVVNWGFCTRYLYVVTALQDIGVEAWWLNAGRAQARTAFQKRGGIDVSLFDVQMNGIEREWSLIKRVFEPRIISGLRPDGSQRNPEDIWSEIDASG